jgi:hypothetical protein
MITAMKLRPSLLVACICLAAASSAWAQAPSTPGAGQPQGGNAQTLLWKCKLPGGSYDVAVGSIVAVSSHEYLVDGAARVTEVNIDTTGSMLARFYYLEPALPKDSALPGAQSGSALIEKAEQQLADVSKKTGLDHWKKVVKNYPTTTHARTVEYRLSSKQQLAQLFQSVQDSFRNRRAGSFSAEQ